jgi:hypothetical protein
MRNKASEARQMKVQVHKHEGQATGTSEVARLLYGLDLNFGELFRLILTLECTSSACNLHHGERDRRRNRLATMVGPMEAMMLTMELAMRLVGE